MSLLQIKHMNKTRVRKGSVTVGVNIIQADKKKETELNLHPQPEIFRGGWGTIPARGPTPGAHCNHVTKLPTFQDIEFGLRESQTSCNHGLGLQCLIKVHELANVFFFFKSITKLCVWKKVG